VSGKKVENMIVELLKKLRSCNVAPPSNKIKKFEIVDEKKNSILIKVKEKLENDEDICNIKEL